MSKIINGKKSLSDKPKASILTDDMVFGERNSIPPAIKADMDKKGWTPRWLNAIAVKKNYGLHSKGWKVYKVPADIVPDFKDGTNPDGVVVRGDLILGYKEREEYDLHKKLLEQKARNSSRLVHGEDLRSFARSHGIKTEVIEGDEDE